MHNIKTKCSIFIIFLLFSNHLFSLNKNIFDMDASLSCGLLNGTINEYVFADSCKNTDNLLSRLDWDIYCVPIFTGEANFSFLKYISLSLGGKVGIPSSSGNMKDYDWLNSTPPPGYSNWINEDPTELTNYSIHNNQVDLYYNWNVTFGGIIPTPIKLNFTPYIGFEYDFIDMSSMGGFRIYKSEDFRKETFGKDQKVISYSQLFYAMNLGLKIDFNYIKNLLISFNFNACPTVGKLIAVDKHYLSKAFDRPYGTAFIDIYDKIHYYNWALSLSYKISKYFYIGLLGNVHYMPLLKGMTGVGPLDQNGNPPLTVPPSIGSEGGARRFLYDITLKVQFKL